MPRGIDEALSPRFFSEAGGEIVPIVTAEGARELTVRTPKPRLLCVGGGRKTNDLFAMKSVADEDPLLFLLVETVIEF